MKNLLLIFATISILSCNKKQDDPTPVTTQKQSTPTSSNCNKDSTWTRTNPGVKNSLYTFYETCTTITITYKISGQKITIVKPTNADIITNWKDYNAYTSSSDPHKYYYRIFVSTSFKRVIYDVSDAGTLGVGGSGMKMN